MPSPSPADRLRQVRERAERTTVGVAGRRMRELDITHHALVFAALAMVLFVPALVTLAAVLPLGSDSGLAAGWAHHLALDADARHAVQRLFRTPGTVRTPTSSLSAALTVLAAYAWPAELQRVHQSIWGLPGRGWRDRWRPLVWLASFTAALAVVVAVGSLAGGVAGTVLTAVVCAPLTLAWAWWTQRLLLAGRVPWSALLPAAVVTTVGLAAFSVASSVYLSRAIVWNDQRYGSIGVVLVLMSWLTHLSLVLLGGAVVGHALHRHRAVAQRPAGAGSSPARDEGDRAGTPDAGLRTTRGGRHAADSRRDPGAVVSTSAPQRPSGREVLRAGKAVVTVSLAIAGQMLARAARHRARAPGRSVAPPDAPPNGRPTTHGPLARLTGGTP